MKKIIALMVFCLLGFSSLPVLAGGIPLEPSLHSMDGWEPVTDRNVIISFGEFEFKHHMIVSPEPHVSCGKVQVKGNEVWLLTDEQNPYIYIIQLEPNAYRKRGDLDWEGVMGKTNGWIKD